MPGTASDAGSGETLATRLSKGPLPIDHALRCASEIISALDDAHRQGITHRDLKPANIMLTRGGAKLLDFGLARQAADEPEQLTQTRAILGTPGYMPPEQVDGQELDGRADLFSLGCVLYRMATGQSAFGGHNAVARLLAVKVQEPEVPTKLDPWVPDELSDLILKMLAKKAEDRPASAQEIARCLRDSRPRVHHHAAAAGAHAVRKQCGVARRDDILEVLVLRLDDLVVVLTVVLEVAGPAELLARHGLHLLASWLVRMK